MKVSPSHMESQAGTKTAILTLAWSAFVIVTTEFIVVGLLPTMARDLEVSVASVGQLVTVFSVIVMLGGPLMTLLLSRYDRRRLFVCTLLVFAACNAASAMSPTYWTLMLSRVLPALLVPVFWGIGSDVAGKIAGPEKAGNAVSQVYFGVTAALLFGVPLGTLLGGIIGWRGSFWILAAFSLVAALMLAIVMPKVAADEQLSASKQLQSLNNLYFAGNVVISIATFTAMFAAYTYLTDMLERSAKIAPENVGWWLMAFGAVGLVGNYFAGLMVDNHPKTAGITFSLLLACGIGAMTLFPENLLLFVVSLAVWGVAHTALFPLCQIRVMTAASDGKALAATFNISAANAGIALGAFGGGWAIESASLEIAMAGASVLIVACAMCLPFLNRLRRGHDANSGSEPNRSAA